MFKHPSYYKKLRERNKSDRAISLTLADGCNSSVRPGLGHKRQASSNKLQAPSSWKKEPQASSVKHRGSSFKPQASSALIPDPEKSFTDL